MSAIPCLQDILLRQQVEEFAEQLKTTAHTLAPGGMSEADFYESGLFRAAIERIRGQFSATMRDKRDFVRRVLNHMQDRGHIVEWDSSGESNRHDYSITLPDGRISVVELKGCLDGNNTTIFQRPQQAQEFIIWSVCSNPNADPQHNVWSGIHTRLSAEIISRPVQVDGLVVWDWVCGSPARPCPKLVGSLDRVTILGQYQVPPPCLYLFPRTTPNARSNPNPEPHMLQSVGLLAALHNCFGGKDEEVSSVQFEVNHRGPNTTRVTTITRGGVRQKTSKATTIRRD